MHWTEIMEKMQAMPQNKEEWVQAAADTAGVTVTLLWLSGGHQLANELLHTCIGVVTLASVTFSLYIKYRNYRKSQRHEN
jgi:hypothetical protein